MVVIVFISMIVGSLVLGAYLKYREDKKGGTIV